MIVTRKLGKVYPGGVQALSDLSLAIPQGDFVFLVGPNGAGKTTFFKLLIREESISSGRILFQGRDISSLRAGALARHRRLVGAVFQDVRLLATRTVRENVTLPLQTSGLNQAETRERTDSVLFLTGLEDLADRFPTDLSGGQRQQVAIARALVNRPRVILADEPTGNLSPSATERIIRLLSVINSCGITVVIATHDSHIVDALGRRVLVLDRGKLVSDLPQSEYPAFLRSQAA